MKNKVITKVNLNFLERLEIYDNKVCNIFEFKKFRKSLFVNTKEGFYGLYGPYTKEELEEGTTNETSSKLLVDSDNIVYYPPVVIMTFTSGEKIRKYFKTFDEAINCDLNFPTSETNIYTEVKN